MIAENNQLKKELKQAKLNSIRLQEKIYDLETDNAWLQRCQKVLKKLIDLKYYKDKVGKTSDYKCCQYYVWDEARKALRYNKG